MMIDCNVSSQIVAIFKKTIFEHVVEAKSLMLGKMSDLAVDSEYEI